MTSILAALLLVVAIPTYVLAAGSHTTRHLANGTLLRQSKQHGLGQLTISNTGQQLDAVPILTTLHRTPVVSVYVRARDSFTLKGIADGTYYLYVTVGQGWDSRTGNFTSQVSRYRFKQPIRFHTVRTALDTQYSVFKVTLYTVAGGNAATAPVDQGAFPRP